MRQWKSLVPAALHLHAPASPSCFPQPPAPSPCPSPPREDTTTTTPPPTPPTPPPRSPEKKKSQMVRLVKSDGKARLYAPPVTARDVMQEHPCHLVCRSDALLLGEKLPALAPGEQLEPGQAYFLLPDHLFQTVLSFVNLASSLLLALNKQDAEVTAAAAAAGGGKQTVRPFELLRNASGVVQIKFSEAFLFGWEAEEVAAAEKEPNAVLLRGDKRLAKDYEELVGYSKSRRWAPKLETIEEVVAAAGNKSGGERGRKSRGALPFLGRLGSRRRHRDAAVVGGSAAVACSG